MLKTLLWIADESERCCLVDVQGVWQVRQLGCYEKLKTLLVL